MALQMKPTMAQQLRRPSVAVCATSPAARTPEASKRAATKATRAPSAYNLYVKEHYQSVSARLKAKGLPADLTNVGKHLRQQWSALSDREKAPYAAKSQKLKEEIAGTGSRSTSPVAARGVARASSASIRPTSPGASRAVSPSARGQRPATPQPTSKPLPPYEAFITEQFPAVKASHANASAAEITKLIEEMWARVPQAQKDAKALRYKAELAAYMSGSGSSSSSARTSPQPARSSSAPRSYSPAPTAAPRAPTPSQRPSTPRGAAASKPLPPFEAFTQDQFAVIKSSNPKASTSEISRMIDDLWARVPQSTKDAKQKRYETELAAYNAGNNGASRGYSPAPARTSTPASRSYSPAPAARAPTPSQRPSTPRGAPASEPLPPFEAFSKEQYLVIKATYPKAGDSEINRMISDMWNKLPSSLKDAKEARYKTDLAAFRASGGSSSAGYSSASRTSSPARSYSPAPAARSSTPTRAASPRPSGQRPETPRPGSVEPLPPFEAFHSEQSQVIKATYPKASQSEVDRMISDMWNKLPSSLKDAKEARYKSDLAAFRASGGSSSAGYSSASRTSSPARSYSSAPASRTSSPTRAASPRPSGQRPETPRANSVEPLPPFEAFHKEQSQVIKATYPKASQSEVDRMINDMWSKLPSSLKDAKEARYKTELAAFRASGGSSSAGYSSASRTSSPARSYSPAPVSRSSTPTRAASPRPSGQRPETPRPGSTEPLPPFEAFHKEQSQVIKATYAKASQSEVDRMISDMWNKLPSSLKDAKEARYRADLAAYNSQNGTSASPRSSAAPRSYSPAPARSYSPAPAARAPTPSQRPSTPRGAPTTEPLPPFEAFSKEQYMVIKASHPKSSDHEINRLINELWARVPQAQKDAKQKRYEADLSAYRSGGGSSAAPRSYSPAPAARSSYSPAPARTVSPRPSGQRPETPRAGSSEPLPPFEAFAKEQSSVIKAGNPRASDSEINRMVSDLWSRVPQSTKDAKQKRYEAELAAYNQSQGGSRYNSSAAPRRQTATVRRY